MKAKIFLILFLSIIPSMTFAQVPSIEENQNLLVVLNHDFARFLILEQAIEVVELVSESGLNLRVETEEKLSHDLGMAYQDMIKEHERLKVMFGDTPLYRAWRLNSDILFQEGLTRAGLNEFQISRRDKLFRQKAAILSSSVSSIENPSLGSLAYWTGKYQTPGELTQERIYAIKTLDVLKDRRAFEVLFDIVFGRGTGMSFETRFASVSSGHPGPSENAFSNEIKTEALLVLGKNLPYWTKSQLQQLVDVMHGSTDPLLEMTRAEAQRLIDSNHEPLPEPINHLSQNYKEMFDGAIELPIHGAKRITYDVAVHPLQAFSIPTRILNGILEAFIYGIGGAPEGVIGLSTGGAYGFAGKELGHQVITTALIAVPTFKMARGMRINGQRPGGDPSLRIQGAQDDGGDMNSWTPNLSPETSWGEPSSVFETGSSINTSRYASPNLPMALLETLPEIAFPELKLGNATSILEPTALPFLPLPQKSHIQSNLMDSFMNGASNTTGLEEDPQNFYWISVALGYSGILDQPEKNKKRVFIVRKNADGQVTGYFMKDIDEDTDPNSMKTSVFDEIYSVGGAPSKINIMNAPQGSAGSSLAAHGNSGVDPDPLDKIDIHAIRSIDDLFPPEVKTRERPLRVVSLGTGILPVWEQVLEERFNVRVTGIELQQDRFKGDIDTQLKGGMLFNTDYKTYTPQELFDVVIFNYPDPGFLVSLDVNALMLDGTITFDQMLEKWFQQKAELIRQYIKPNGIAILVTEQPLSLQSSIKINPIKILERFFGSNNAHRYQNVADYYSLGLSPTEIDKRPCVSHLMGRPTLLDGEILDGSFYIIRNAPEKPSTPLNISVNVQLDIWKLRKQGRTEDADRLQAELIEFLIHAPIVSNRKLGVGNSEPDLVTFSNGVRGVFKRENQDMDIVNPLAELATFEMDRLLGLNIVPTTVLRDVGERMGSLQVYIPNALNAYEVILGGAGAINLDWSAKIRFLDFLILNKDLRLGTDGGRAAKNILLRTDHEDQMAIDHGMAFRLSSNREEVDQAEGEMWKHLKADVNQFYPGDDVYARLKALTDDEIRRILKPLIDEEAIQEVIRRKHIFIELVETEKQKSVYRTHNPNAQIPSENYPFAHARAWKLIQEYMGPTFVDHVNQGAKGVITIDSGSGLGMGVLQASQDNHIHAVAINVQDMWPKVHAYDDVLSRMGKEELEAEVEDLIRGKMVYGIRKDEVGQFFEASVGIPPSTRQGLIVGLPNAIHGVVELYQRQTQAGAFEYRVGYAEEILPEYQGQAYTIIDLFGAFFYSPNRHTLLEQYYNALSSEGKAFIYIVGDDEYGIQHQVQTPEGFVSLYDYLVKKFPTVFSVFLSEDKCVRQGLPYKRGRRFVIQRDPNIQELHLGLEIQNVQIVPVKEVEGLEVPRVVFRESESK